MIKSEKRLKLSVRQCASHYSFMLVLLIFPAFDLFYKINSKDTINIFPGSTNAVFVALSLIVGYSKWKELFFYEVSVTRTDEEFENAVLASANKLRWSITKFNDRIVNAIGFNMWKSRSPQKITIIREPDKVLINSMIEPDFLSAPDFFGINKKNRSTFLEYYELSSKVKDLNEKVVQALKDEAERIENESEWSLKNTLKRIIAYLLSLGFFGIGIAIWNYEGFDLTAMAISILGLFYIVVDLYVLWTKKSKGSS